MKYYDSQQVDNVELTNIFSRFRYPWELSDAKMGASVDILSDIGTPAVVLDCGENSVMVTAFVIKKNHH